MLCNDFKSYNHNFIMKLKTPSILDVRSTIQCSAFHYNDVEYPINKEALMIRRTLNVHIKDDDLERYFSY